MGYLDIATRHILIQFWLFIQRNGRQRERERETKEYIGIGKMEIISKCNYKLCVETIVEAIYRVFRIGSSLSIHCVLYISVCRSRCLLTSMYIKRWFIFSDNNMPSLCHFSRMFFLLFQFVCSWHSLGLITTDVDDEELFQCLFQSHSSYSIIKDNL